MVGGGRAECDEEGGEVVTEIAQVAAPCEGVDVDAQLDLWVPKARLRVNQACRMSFASER